MLFAAGASNLKRMLISPGYSKLLIYGDNDSPGLLAAKKCAQNHAARNMKTTVFVPSGPDDFSEQLRKTGSIDPIEVTEENANRNSVSNGWPAVTPLPTVSPMGGDISNESIPIVLRNTINEWAKIYGVPRAYPLFGFFSVLGGMASSYFSVEVRDGYVVQPNIYIVIVGPPGQIKSPSLGPYRKFLQQMEEPFKQLNAEIVNRFNADMALFRSKEKALKGALSKKVSIEQNERERLESDLQELHKTTPKAPILYHLYTQDATPEALVEAVACGFNLHLAPDEFATLLGACAKKGREDLRSILLTGYSGSDSVKQLRLTRAVNVPERISLSILSSTQDDVLLHSISQEQKFQSTADGFYQRIQFITAMKPDYSKGTSHE